MNITDLNNNLRDVFLALTDKGYKKTDIGKLLLGSNGYAPLSRFIATDDSKINFGIKPLGRIAEQSGYTLQLAFVKQDDQQTCDSIDTNNHEFFENLPEMVERYLNKSYSDNMQKTRKSKSSDVISSMLDELGL